MTEVPAYFDPIRQRAAARWDQLVKDPELAGPWHQLFKQVQSPRNVQSELLQNADDAGTKATAVRIEEGAFVFEHDGEDFAEEHFASQCGFGHSNKPSLHTIGFQGIGIKSTFSLGGRVEVCTPTFSVCFDRHWFTEPVWLNGERTTGRTRVRVAIADNHRLREIEKNIADRQKSPLSQLFFKHLRSMQMGAQEVRWTLLRDGLVPDSSFMALNGNNEGAFLLLRSPPADFPEGALAEIRQERMLTLGGEMDFPPCRVEIALGAKGRLFVALPSGVETMLPFASNALFIQDPARLKIKDPEISPTNRWPFQRVGDLTSDGMLAWLHLQQSPVSDRARAFGLFSDVDRDDRSLEVYCATIVEEAFEGALAGKPSLLAEAGSVMPADQAAELSNTTWLVTSELELIPYIDGTPAGTLRRADVLWVARVLYTIDLSMAKLARRVTEEVARSFNRAEIKAALGYSFDRFPDDIRSYLGENFILAARGEAQPETDNGAPVSGAPPEGVPAGTPPCPAGVVSERATASFTSAGETDLSAPAPQEDDTEVDDNGFGDEESPTDDEVDFVKRSRSPQKPSKPLFIERFALAHGFKRDGDERFYHEDGSWIVKVSGSTFPWERRNSAGEIVRYYWPREHCLDLEPLEVESEVWGLIDKTPTAYSFVLATTPGDPIEVPGTHLRALLETGALKLYPAAYRLLLEGEAHV